MRDTPLPRRRKNKRQVAIITLLPQSMQNLPHLQDDGMSWDDSGMNITVNPLDDVEKNVVGEEFSDDDESTDGEERLDFISFSPLRHKTCTCLLWFPPIFCSSALISFSISLQSFLCISLPANTSKCSQNEFSRELFIVCIASPLILCLWTSSCDCFHRM